MFSSGFGALIVQSLLNNQSWGVSGMSLELPCPCPALSWAR